MFSGKLSPQFVNEISKKNSHEIFQKSQLGIFKFTIFIPSTVQNPETGTRGLSMIEKKVELGSGGDLQNRKEDKVLNLPASKKFCQDEMWDDGSQNVLLYFVL